ncbi:MAG TPA: type II secretion system major pseudopilin GspG [Candidatus Babeliales bacterium]|nr:type II secretion system major pseudopilin GspG [Candidatus Babeliales bacterium]
MNRTVRAGFTLVEILIALAIIAIIGAIGIPSYLSYTKKANKQQTEANIRVLSAAIESYQTDIGQLPETLEDLVRKPFNEELAKNWPGNYLKGKTVPKDAWKHPFHYAVTPGQEHPYELYSYGPNGKSAPQSEWISVWNL